MSMEENKDKEESIEEIMNSAIYCKDAFIDILEELEDGSKLVYIDLGEEE